MGTRARRNIQLLTPQRALASARFSLGFPNRFRRCAVYYFGFRVTARNLWGFAACRILFYWNSSFLACFLVTVVFWNPSFLAVQDKLIRKRLMEMAPRRLSSRIEKKKAEREAWLSQLNAEVSNSMLSITLETLKNS